MPLAVLPSAIARSTNTQIGAGRAGALVGSGIFGDDVGLLRIGELPTAQAFVNANDLIFADIIMG
jgi:hypothetical protein